MINLEKFQEACSKTAYFFYIIEDCEQGSNGHSGWSYYGVALGNSELEAVINWAKWIEDTYGIPFNPYIRHEDWYVQERKVNIIPLLDSVYGHADKIQLSHTWKEHED